MHADKIIRSFIIACGLVMSSFLSAQADPYVLSTIDVPSTPATGTVTGTLAFNVTNPVAGDNRTPYVIGLYFGSGPTSGSHGYVLSGATPQNSIVSGNFEAPVDFPGNTSANRVSGINDHGDIIGRYTQSNVIHGFTRLNGATSLSTFDVPASFGASGTRPFGINNADAITGNYFVGTGTVSVRNGILAVPDASNNYPAGNFSTINVPFAGASGTEIYSNNSKARSARW